MSRLNAEDLRNIRRVEIDEDGNVLLDGTVLETADPVELGTQLCRLGTRIHTAALEWEPAGDEPGPFEWAPDGHRVPRPLTEILGEAIDHARTFPTAVPDIAGADL